jgi:hypothetical protein
LLVRVCGHSDANRMPTEKRLDAMTDCRDTMVISRVQSLLHAVRDSAFQIVMGVSKTAFHSRRASLSQSLSAPLIPLSGGGEQLVEAAHSGFQDMYRVGCSAVV